VDEVHVVDRLGDRVLDLQAGQAQVRKHGTAKGDQPSS
jgi:hypothetical protein